MAGSSVSWSERAVRLLRRMNSFYSAASLKPSLPQKYEVMPQFSDPPLMCMERAATSLFGVKRYGVHVNGFTRQPDGQLAMWVARRSLSKQTYPGLLDNMVAGGIASQKGIRDTLIKECSEEASIPECIAAAARPVGTVSYTYEDGEGVFSECQFVFDLEVSSDFSPSVGDGEVHQFYLWPIEKVKDALVTEEFKQNCALVVLDFLIRHSYLHPDTGECATPSPTPTPTPTPTPLCKSFYTRAESDTFFHIRHKSHFGIYLAFIQIQQITLSLHNEKISENILNSIYFSCIVNRVLHDRVLWFSFLIILGSNVCDESQCGAMRAHKHTDMQHCREFKSRLALCLMRYT
ncbi:UNVERIFIED_CONTAM: hypothetical protein FKN15_032318 [Acipenser sinensis]